MKIHHFFGNVAADFLVMPLCLACVFGVYVGDEVIGTQNFYKRQDKHEQEHNHTDCRACISRVGVDVPELHREREQTPSDKNPDDARKQTDEQFCTFCILTADVFFLIFVDGEFLLLRRLRVV